METLRRWCDILHDVESTHRFIKDGAATDHGNLKVHVVTGPWLTMSEHPSRGVTTASIPFAPSALSMPSSTSSQALVSQRPSRGSTGTTRGVGGGGDLLNALACALRIPHLAGRFRLKRRGVGGAAEFSNRPPMAESSFHLFFAAWRHNCSLARKTQRSSNRWTTWRKCAHVGFNEEAVPVVVHNMVWFQNCQCVEEGILCWA